MNVLAMCRFHDVDDQRFIAHGVHNAKPASHSELVRAGMVFLSLVKNKKLSVRGQVELRSMR